jgi:hypothetical protein
MLGTAGIPSPTLFTARPAIAFAPSRSVSKTSSNKGHCPCATPVENDFELRLTGPVKQGVLFKVNCLAQNPPAEMRGGFFAPGSAIKQGGIMPGGVILPDAVAIRSVG